MSEHGGQTGRPLDGGRRDGSASSPLSASYALSCVALAQACAEAEFKLSNERSTAATKEAQIVLAHAARKLLEIAEYAKETLSEGERSGEAPHGEAPSDAPTSLEDLGY